jgi:hypothetical protein
MKSRLHKLNGLTHSELKTNMTEVIRDKPKEKYENLIKETFNRTEKFIRKPSNKTKKRNNYL